MPAYLNVSVKVGARVKVDGKGEGTVKFIGPLKVRTCTVCVKASDVKATYVIASYAGAVRMQTTAMCSMPHPLGSGGLWWRVCLERVVVLLLAP